MIKKIINYLLIAIGIILFIILQYLINKLGIIPQKYYLLFTIVEVLLFAIAIVFSFFKKIVFYIISIILSILLIVTNSFGYYYIKNFDKFIDKGFTGEIVNLTSYLVVTSSNNEITDIKEVTLDKKINYYTHSINNEIAKEKLGNYVYEPVDNLENYLQTNKESKEYLLIDKTNYSIFTELKTDSDKDYKILYDFDIETVEERNFEVKDSYNIFVIGKDFWGRDDLNLLITVNTNTHEVLFTSMPRDLYIDAVGYNFKDSLTGMYCLGDDVVIKSIENFYGITIDYKVKVFTENLVDIVDKLGGLEFCSNKSFTTTHAKVIGTYDDSTGSKMYVKKGCYTYNGIEILTIARERKAFNPKGDHQRQENCRKILINILKKLGSMSTLSNYTEILDSLNGLYSTNMNRNAVAILIRSAIDNKGYSIYEQHVGGELYNRPLGIERWNGPAIYPDQGEADSARAKIQEILNK